MLFPEFKVFAIPELLCVLVCVSLLLLTVNYLVHYFPVSRLNGKRLEGNYNEEPVSIIICAKNEEDNLTEFLPKVLSQEYANFEVVVVNDCSWDNTEHVIDEFAKIFPNLRKANIKEDAYYKHGKKFAMLVGIKAATHNRLVFTDADCYPASTKWLSETVKGFNADKEIVLGYGAYEKKSGFLNLLIRYDTFIIAVQYLSAAIKAKAYMGVGRNLAYTKELFFKEKGFSRHYHIISGDDDLFVNQAANEKNVNVIVDKDAITYSKPKQTFKDWRIQKARHLTTAPLYKQSSQLKITFNYFTLYFFYLSLLSLCLHPQTLLLLPIIFTIKCTLQIILLNKAIKKLNEQDLLWRSSILEPALLIIYPIFHMTKLFYKPNKWNH